MTTLKRRLVAITAIATLAGTGLAVGAATHTLAGSRWGDDSIRPQVSTHIVAGSRWGDDAATTVSPDGSRWG